MTRLPVISGDECIAALNKVGYRVDRVKGSHAWLVCSGRSPIPVPKHHELGRGLLRNIIKSANLTVDEFVEILKK